MTNKNLKIITGMIAFSLCLYIVFFHSKPETPSLKMAISTDMPQKKTAVVAKEIMVRGMVCDDCSKRIRENIMRINGVRDIEISYKSERVVVYYDKGTVSTIHLINMISSLGYDADLVESSGKLKVIDYKFSY